MDKLVKKFEEVIKDYETAYLNNECENKDLVKEQLLLFFTHKLAKECGQIAIEFAKHYLSGTIKKHYAGSIGDESKVEEYRTPEMDLLLGDLIKDGENNFNKFLEDYGK